MKTHHNNLSHDQTSHLVTALVNLQSALDTLYAVCPYADRRPTDKSASLLWEAARRIDWVLEHGASDELRDAVTWEDDLPTPAQ